MEDLAITVGSKDDIGPLSQTLGAEQATEELKPPQMNECPSGSQPKDGENKSSSGVTTVI